MINRLIFNSIVRCLRKYRTLSNYGDRLGKIL